MYTDMDQWTEIRRRVLVNKQSKRSPYDGGVRTPVIINWPGHVKPSRRPELVSAIDPAPTILSACSLEPTPQMPGVNLLDVVTGKSKLARKAALGEVFVHTAMDVNNPAENLTHRWVREDNWSSSCLRTANGVPSCKILPTTRWKLRTSRLPIRTRCSI